MSAEDRQDVGLGKAVELRRTELGLKRRELAERARLSYPYISEIENGVKEPSAKALRQIAEALEMSFVDLARLSERVEGGSTDTSSILLPPDEPAAVPRLLADAPPAAADSLSQLGSAHSAMPEEPQPSAESDPVILEAVRQELDRWRRDELPSLIREEVERQLDARDDGPSDR